MAKQVDLPIASFQDGTIVVQMTPPTNVGGQSFVFEVAKRFGGGGFNGSSGLVVKTVDSGYGGGQSGITVADSGQGVFNIAWNSINLSGLDPGNYAFQFYRNSSGARLPVNEGYVVSSPSID